MKWVSAQEVIGFHDRLLTLLPGIPGMPDPERAEAIIHRVQNQLYYENVTDIYALAAIYLVAIARGHIFNDGNKRTAFFVAMVFLNRNGIAIRDEDDELEELTVSAATGAVTPDQVAAVLRRLSLSS
ncbi:type II toxin-antitoxin system death-on-curing family toxin [Pantoea sp. PGP6]